MSTPEQPTQPQPQQPALAAPQQPGPVQYGPYQAVYAIKPPTTPLAVTALILGRPKITDDIVEYLSFSRHCRFPALRGRSMGIDPSTFQGVAIHA